MAQTDERLCECCIIRQSVVAPHLNTTADLFFPTVPGDRLGQVNVVRVCREATPQRT